MPYVTTDDLKAQALWMSGEPVNGTSDYDEQVLAYMQYIYNVLITGTTVGTRDMAISAGLYSLLANIPQTDWIWLHKFPSFAFVTTPACIGSSSSVPLNQGVQIGTMSLVYGSDVVNFSIAPHFVEAGVNVSVQDARITVLNQEQGVPYPPYTTPRIVLHPSPGSTVAGMDAPWPQETQTVSNFVIWKSEYPMPSDFERFCEAWKVQGGWISGTQPLNVGSNEQVFDLYPVTNAEQGPPTAAARMSPDTLMVNRWDTFSYRIEGSYIFRPDDLEVNATPDLQEPVVPLRWRQILAVGAAMLILQDKGDGRSDAYASQFREIIRQMGVETRKELVSGSELTMRMLTRKQSRKYGTLGTRSGLRFW